MQKAMQIPHINMPKPTEVKTPIVEILREKVSVVASSISSPISLILFVLLSSIATASTVDFLISFYFSSLSSASYLSISS